MRGAIKDGSIEEMLTWHSVSPGDFFYIPANTVHAIGAGITLVEVQQNSDITYRLYDYGRPRELHIEEAAAVALRKSYPSHYIQRLAATGAAQLVNGPFFRLDRLDGAPDKHTTGRYDGALLVLPLDCTLAIGETLVTPGQCAHVEGIHAISFPANGLSLIAQPV
jgi:mannose-6-phosphate isomerase